MSLSGHVKKSSKTFELRKPDFVSAKTKDADQLDSTIPGLPKSKISSF